MIKFLKSLYYDLYEIPTIYLGFEDTYVSHVFTIFIIIFYIVIILSVIKNAKDYFQLRKINKVLQRKIDKLLVVSFLKKY